MPFLRYRRAPRQEPTPSERDAYTEAEDYARDGWKPGTIVHQQQPEGGRGLDAYERQLGFTRDQLAGKRVLDLGSGPEAKLARTLTAEGITSLVVSLSPDYVFPKYSIPLKAAGAPIPEGKPAESFVAGKGQQLPFVENAFDVVLGLHVAEHVSLADSIAILREVNRVTAPNGWVRYGALVGTFDHDIHDAAAADETLQAELAAKGNTLTRTYIDPTIVPPTRLRHDALLTYHSDAYLLS
ncbi:MAG TPA: class I SAM-dependent methyltransferase, partial [Candidatus Saccharimonadales bacterium]|nr:class I SAM-dependent methyltransferase [Candidatus Saccharimonadales bacterium]